MPIIPGMSDETAAAMLTAERVKVERQRQDLLAEMRVMQTRLDQLDQRLREISQGERVLSNHGRRGTGRYA